MEFGLIAVVGIILLFVAGILTDVMDSGFLAVATFVIAILTLQYGFGIGVWSLVTGNWLLAVAFVLGYVLFAAAYVGLWRFPEYIRDNKDKIMDSYMKWSRNRKDTQDNSFDAFMDSDDYRFKVSMHKERLGAWAACWPFSLTWELSRKPAIWLWNTLYSSFGEVLEKIGRSTARKLHDKG